MRTHLLARFVLPVLLLAVGCGVAPEEEDLLEEALGETEADRTAESLNPVDNFETPDVSAAACTVTINKDKELMIRHLGVVNDPVRTVWTGAVTHPKDGAWSFGRLMANMSGTTDPAVFTRTWLAKWETNRTVNTFSVPARTQIRTQIINAWPKLADGRLDLRRAPFRLLAIVNRMDLRNLASGNAGEGRFVFGALGPAGESLQFTVIFEFKLPATTAAEATRWASSWHGLGALTGAAYNDALQAITDRFSGKNVAPTRRNGSSLGQIRTNEIALSFPWELRQFGIGASATNNAGQLVQTTVTRNPAIQFNNTAKVARFINANKTAILAGTHSVPLAFEGAAFRAGGITNNIDFWQGDAATVVDPKARHLFSLNTCDGCHGRETDTIFLQVNPRERTTVATLAGFLTGVTVADPVTGQNRTFNDLTRRATDLKNVLCTPSIALSEAALTRTH